MHRLKACWGPLWRVSLLALGVYFAVTSTWADQINMWGCRHADLTQIERAASIFPYDWFIRTKPGFFYIETGNYSFVSEDKIAKVLKTDPYSVDLLTALYVRQVKLGDHAQALQTSLLIKRIAPKSALIQILEGTT